MHFFAQYTDDEFCLFEGALAVDYEANLPLRDFQALKIAVLKKTNKNILLSLLVIHWIHKMHRCKLSINRERAIETSYRITKALFFIIIVSVRYASLK